MKPKFQTQSTTKLPVKSPSKPLLKPITKESISPAKAVAKATPIRLITKPPKPVLSSCKIISQTTPVKHRRVTSDLPAYKTDDSFARPPSTFAHPLLNLYDSTIEHNMSSPKFPSPDKSYSLHCLDKIKDLEWLEGVSFDTDGKETKAESTQEKNHMTMSTIKPIACPYTPDLPILLPRQSMSPGEDPKPRIYIKNMQVMVGIMSRPIFEYINSDR